MEGLGNHGLWDPVGSADEQVVAAVALLSLPGRSLSVGLLADVLHDPDEATALRGGPVLVHGN